MSTQTLTSTTNIATLATSNETLAYDIYLFNGEVLKFPVLLEPILTKINLFQLATLELNISKSLYLYEQAKTNMEEAGEDIKSDDSYYVGGNIVVDQELTESYETLLDNMLELARLQTAINDIL
jgi:hypothetical protein